LDTSSNSACIAVFIRVEVANSKVSFASTNNDLQPICFCIYRNGWWIGSWSVSDFIENVFTSNKASTQMKPLESSKESVPPFCVDTIVLNSGPNVVTGSPMQTKTVVEHSLDPEFSRPANATLLKFPPSSLTMGTQKPREFEYRTMASITEQNDLLAD
jgi:hypothetical protein